MSINPGSSIFNNVLQAYVEVGDFTNLLKLMERRVAANPGDYNVWVQLGAAYLQLGRRAESIEALQKAIELNLGFKEQGEYFISEIKAGRNP